MMLQNHTTFFLLLTLCLIQGGSGQAWGENFTRDPICAVTGSSVVIPCSYTHPPDVTVTQVFWTKNPQPGTESTDLSVNDNKGRVSYSIDLAKNCTVILKDMKLEDAGMYHPRILGTKENKWLGQPGVRLIVTDLFVVIPGLVTEGDDKVKISCKNTCSSRVIWRKNGVDITREQTYSDKLVLERVRIEDEGYYSCVLKGFEGYPSEPVELNVMFSPRNTILSVTPADRIPMGHSALLTCTCDANPPVENYTWFKVNDSTPVGSGQQYNITNIRSEDGGQYYCEARNKYGAENSTAVSITVKEDNTLMIYVVIGVPSGCGLLGLLLPVCFIRFHCRALNTKDTKQQNVGSGTDNMPTNAYGRGTFHQDTNMELVYQNYIPKAIDNVDDEIYQNV